MFLFLGVANGPVTPGNRAFNRGPRLKKARNGPHRTLRTIIVADIDMQQRVSARLMELPFDLVDVDYHVALAGASPFERDSRGPKGSGYRAIHLVHRVDERLLETQVRTVVQHGWAVAVERAEQITRFPLKFGDAPPELLDYFRVASMIHALEERDVDVDADLTRELAELRERIRRYYRSSR